MVMFRRAFPRPRNGNIMGGSATNRLNGTLLSRYLPRIIALAVAIALSTSGMAAIAAPSAATGSDSAVSQGDPRRVVVGFQPRSDDEVLSRARGMGAGLIRRARAGDFIVLKTPPGLSSARFAERMARMPGVRYAEPDSRAEASWTPNDSEYPLQWAPPKIGMPAVWDVTRGRAEVRIAIVDTGVDIDHPDLVDRFDGKSGWDFVNGDGIPDDDNGHGTHVAGIAAATTDNGKLVAGIAGSSTILPYKVLGPDASGWTTDIAEGVLMAVQQNADVINLSLGTRTDSQSLREAVATAVAAGRVVVAATGNAGVTPIDYPADYPGVIAVAATDAADRSPIWSNYGPSVDVSAPGLGIRSTWNNGSSREDSGTSMSAPFVSGVAALIRTAHPTLDRVQIEYALTSTAVDLGPAGRDPDFGYGRLDAYKAVLRPITEATATIPAQTFTGSSITPPFTLMLDGLELVAGRDYTAEYRNNIEVGTAFIDITGIGAYRETLSIPFTIAPIDIVRSTISMETTWAFTGAPIEPTVTVEFDGRTLVEGVDYRTTFVDNTDAGTAHVRIEGIGVFGGVTTLPFVIEPQISGIAGRTLYDTAASIALAAYPPESGGSDTVILATGRRWEDALAGSPLAGVLDAPILLVDGSLTVDALPASVRDALRDLSPTDIVILGGARVVTSELEADLKRLSYAVDRVWGMSHYDTADHIATEVIGRLGAGWDGTAVFATGYTFPDALAVAPITVSQKWPVFLVDPAAQGGLTSGAQTHVSRITRAIVIGGERAVSPLVESRFTADSDGAIERLWGTTWAGTAGVIATFGVQETGLSWDRIAVTTGLKPYDALAGGVLQAKRGSVLLLTDGKTLSPEAARVLTDHKESINRLYVLGGTSAVSETVRTSISDILRP